MPLREKRERGRGRARAAWEAIFPSDAVPCSALGTTLQTPSTWEDAEGEQGELLET